MKLMDDKDKKRFGVKLTTPPTFGFPNRPLEPSGEPPRSEQRCGNCNAFALMAHPVLGPQPMCRAEPVRPIFIGFDQTKTINPKTGQPSPYPIIIGTQAPTDPDNGWCRCWQWVGPDGGNK